MVEHAGTTKDETNIAVDVKEEVLPQEPITVSGGAPASRKPLAEAAKEEELSNNRIAKNAKQSTPENDLRRLRVNLTTRQAREASHAKLHDYKTFLVPGGNEIATRQIMQLREEKHPTMRPLKHSNMLHNVDVSLAIHAIEGGNLGAFVPMLRLLSVDDKKEVAVASAKAINECRYDKTKKPWDTFPAAQTESLHTMQGQREQPVYNFSDKAAPNQILDEVLFVGNALVSAKAIEKPPAMSAVKEVPGAMVTQTLDGNVNGKKWHKMGSKLGLMFKDHRLDVEFLPTRCEIPGVNTNIDQEVCQARVVMAMPPLRVRSLITHMCPSSTSTSIF